MASTARVRPLQTPTQTHQGCNHECRADNRAPRAAFPRRNATGKSNRQSERKDRPAAKRGPRPSRWNFNARRAECGWSTHRCHEKLCWQRGAYFLWPASPRPRSRRSTAAGLARRTCWAPPVVSFKPDRTNAHAVSVANANRGGGGTALTRPTATPTAIGGATRPNYGINGTTVQTKH